MRLVTIMCMVLAIATPAFATFSQEFYEDGFNGLFGDFSFNAFAIKLNTGAIESVQFPADQPWSIGYQSEDDTTILATGDLHIPGELLYVTLNFTGDIGPISFDYVAYNGDTIVQSQHIEYDSVSWTAGIPGSGTWTPERGGSVPEPVTIAILGLGTLIFCCRK